MKRRSILLLIAVVILLGAIPWCLHSSSKGHAVKVGAQTSVSELRRQEHAVKVESARRALRLLRDQPRLYSLCLPLIPDDLKHGVGLNEIPVTEEELHKLFLRGVREEAAWVLKNLREGSSASSAVDYEWFFNILRMDLKKTTFSLADFGTDKCELEKLYLKNCAASAALDWELADDEEEGGYEDSSSGLRKLAKEEIQKGDLSLQEVFAAKFILDQERNKPSNLNVGPGPRGMQ